jgi:hypothetical protein
MQQVECKIDDPVMPIGRQIGLEPKSDKPFGLTETTSPSVTLPDLEALERSGD